MSYPPLYSTSDYRCARFVSNRLTERTFTMTDSFTERLPYLEINYPTCGNCGKEVDIEDNQASCEPCGICWNSIAEDAEPAYIVEKWEGETVTPCGHEYLLPEDSPLVYAPCTLPQGHKTSHHYPWKAKK